MERECLGGWRRPQALGGHVDWIPACAGMTSRARQRRVRCHLLLLDFELELRDLLLLPLALARSLCALLFRVLALPPLLAAWARLDLPEDDADAFDEEDFDEDEEDELRDAIACSFG